MPQTKEQGKGECGTGDAGAKKDKDCGKADHKECEHGKQGAQPSQPKKWSYELVY